MSIGSDNLFVLLSALGDELLIRDATAHLVVVGGSAMLAGGYAERTTRDVDIVALLTDGPPRTAEPLPAPIQAAAEAVARNFGLAPDWLNPGPTALLDEATGLPEGFVDRLETRTYGTNLTVGFASRADLIFLKLYALADRGAARDLADLQTLSATAEELHAAARWARTHNMPGAFDDQLRSALAQLGVDDEGRDA